MSVIVLSYVEADVVDKAQSQQAEAPGPVPVAQYVRMSTEHQRYSTDNQTLAISQYAEQHGMRVVRTYEDSGKSGLNIRGRSGLQQLLRDVQEAAVPFRAILVYDISRWGRFPDPDEAAVYEQTCKRRGVKVIYCAEPFTNDGSLSSTVLVGLKRSMAAEYSRAQKPGAAGVSPRRRTGPGSQASTHRRAAQREGDPGSW